MKMDAERQIPDAAMATLKRLRSSVDATRVRQELEALAPKIGDTTSGWRAERHDAHTAVLKLSEGLEKQYANRLQLWADAIGKTSRAVTT